MAQMAAARSQRLMGKKHKKQELQPQQRKLHGQISSAHKAEATWHRKQTLSMWRKNPHFPGRRQQASQRESACDFLRLPRARPLRSSEAHETLRQTGLSLATVKVEAAGATPPSPRSPLAVDRPVDNSHAAAPLGQPSDNGPDGSGSVTAADGQEAQGEAKPEAGAAAPAKEASRPNFFSAQSGSRADTEHVAEEPTLSRPEAAGKPAGISLRLPKAAKSKTPPKERGTPDLAPDRSFFGGSAVQKHGPETVKVEAAGATPTSPRSPLAVDRPVDNSLAAAPLGQPSDNGPDGSGSVTAADGQEAQGEAKPEAGAAAPAKEASRPDFFSAQSGSNLAPRADTEHVAEEPTLSRPEAAGKPAGISLRLPKAAKSKTPPKERGTPDLAPDRSLFGGSAVQKHGPETVKVEAAGATPPSPRSLLAVDRPVDNSHATAPLGQPSDNGPDGSGSVTAAEGQEGQGEAKAEAGAAAPAKEASRPDFFSAQSGSNLAPRADTEHVAEEPTLSRPEATSTAGQQDSDFTSPAAKTEPVPTDRLEGLPDRPRVSSGPKANQPQVSAEGARARSARSAGFGAQLAAVLRIQQHFRSRSKDLKRGEAAVRPAPAPVLNEQDLSIPSIGLGHAQARKLARKVEAPKRHVRARDFSKAAVASEKGPLLTKDELGKSAGDFRSPQMDTIASIKVQVRRQNQKKGQGLTAEGAAAAIQVAFRVRRMKRILAAFPFAGVDAGTVDRSPKLPGTPGEDKDVWAAVRIQAFYRGKLVRKAARQRRPRAQPSKLSKDGAASRIQKMYRSRRAAKTQQTLSLSALAALRVRAIRLHNPRDGTSPPSTPKLRQAQKSFFDVDMPNEETRAAVRIQALYRGKLARRAHAAATYQERRHMDLASVGALRVKVHNLHSKMVMKPTADKGFFDAQPSSLESERDRAATKIQSHFRGKQARSAHRLQGVPDVVSSKGPSTAEIVRRSLVAAGFAVVGEANAEIGRLFQRASLSVDQAMMMGDEAAQRASIAVGESLLSMVVDTAPPPAPKSETSSDSSPDLGSHTQASKETIADLSSSLEKTCAKLRNWLNKRKGRTHHECDVKPSGQRESRLQSGASPQTLRVQRAHSPSTEPENPHEAAASRLLARLSKPAHHRLKLAIVHLAPSCFPGDKCSSCKEVVVVESFASITAEVEFSLWGTCSKCQESLFGQPQEEDTILVAPGRALAALSPHHAIPVAYPDSSSVWPSPFHLFLALHFSDAQSLQLVLATPLGSANALRSFVSRRELRAAVRGDWNRGWAIKAMRHVMSLAVEQHPALAALLLATGTSRIAHLSDDLWGMRLIGGQWAGENLVGKMLEEKRLALAG
ncbi:unnamed protein product [Effrenium voratum]|uniref:NADAR domain-containing protein n=1 Tax=Effrenium voratum TaxID=2562239 RepID=A0AA36MWM4_9DINO|nr:unnamed protein product [Effrenium voratum]